MESHYSLMKVTITYTRESTLILSLMATALNVAKNIMLSKGGAKKTPSCLHYDTTQHKSASNRWYRGSGRWEKLFCPRDLIAVMVQNKREIRY